MSNAITSVNVTEPAKKKNYVRNGAIIGATLGAATSGMQFPLVCKNAGLTLDKMDYFIKNGTGIIDKVLYPRSSAILNKSKALRVLTVSTLFNMPILASAGWGAAIGLAVLGISKLCNRGEKA